MKISHNSLSTWLRCREEWRERYLLNRQPKGKSIHLEYGIAIHRAIEVFWQGKGYDAAFDAAIQYVRSVDLTNIKINERSRWDELVQQLPDLVGVYFDNHSSEEINQLELVEWEFDRPMTIGGDKDGFTTLTGRIDRVMRDSQTATIRIGWDLKTASAVGQDWKEQLRQSQLRNIEYNFYDYVLDLLGKPVQSWKCEVLVKPYKSKPSRYTVIDLPEITTKAYRQRFQQQLKFLVAEISYWQEHYKDMAPWPMASEQVCYGKFAPCSFLPICNYGDSPRVLEGYVERESIHQRA